MLPMLYHGGKGDFTEGIRTPDPQVRSLRFNAPAARLGVQLPANLPANWAPQDQPSPNRTTLDPNRINRLQTQPTSFNRL